MVSSYSPFLCHSWVQSEEFVFPFSDVGCAAQARLGKGREMGTSRAVQEKELGVAKRKAFLYKEKP